MGSSLITTIENIWLYYRAIDPFPETRQPLCLSIEYDLKYSLDSYFVPNQFDSAVLGQLQVFELFLRV